MQISILWLVGVVALMFGGVTLYALKCGRNVKASLKILWAAFSFEANEPEDTGSKNLKRRGP